MRKILFLFLGLSALAACEPQTMDWGTDYDHPTTDELPLELQEKIALYDAINSYTTTTVGVAIDFNLYMTDESYAVIVNENFDQIVPGNELKMESLMNASGEINYGNRMEVIDALRAKGLTVYGHALVWHSQAQARYLNGLIKPTTAPGVAGENLVDNGDFENGDLTGWSLYNPSPNNGNLVVASEAKLEGSYGLKAVSPSDANNDYMLQFVPTTLTLDPSHSHTLSFWVKSDKTGKGRLSFGAGFRGEAAVSYPYLDWEGTGAARDFATSGSWKQISVTFTDTESLQIFFDFGTLPDVTYYFDNITVVDNDATGGSSGPANLLANGGFEAETLGWSTPNAGDGITKSADAKHSGDYGLKAVASSTSDTEHLLQFVSEELTVDPAKTYIMSFYIKSDITGSGRVSFPGKIMVDSGSGPEPNQWPWMNWEGTGGAGSFSTSSEWKKIEVEIVPATTTLQLSFDIGKLPGVTYYVDDIMFYEQAAPAARRYVQGGLSGATRAQVSIPKTDEEKKAIIEPVLIDYIAQVAGHFKGKVAAWDVLNEAVDPDKPSQLRVGVENLSSTNTFPWMLYLGKDYAVTAFKTAREADPDAKLFINDFGLESPGGVKLQTMLDYVAYIDSKSDGAPLVDGVGTQMHLNINWIDKDAIRQMFKSMAATGKLVKISELDVAIDSSSSAGSGPASPVAPTVAQLQDQADIYNFVVKTYMEEVPEAQRFGVTVWGVRDRLEEHIYWLPNDMPFLFDTDNGRKVAYKGFIDGLVGKDVSADWSYGDKLAD